MKNYLIIIALLLFSCNSNQQNKKQNKNEVVNDRCFVYPSEVDSLHIQDLFDSARWYIYALQCDENYLPKSDTSKSISFGELPLRFDNLFIKNDTASLIFNFMDKDQIILPSMTRDYKQLATGVGFNLKAKKKIYIISSNTTITTKNNPTSRYENPMQPEVIKYIKDNWDKLNDCFRELAKRKGIKK